MVFYEVIKPNLLKEASHSHELLDDFLLSHGFSKYTSDTNVYVKHDHNSLLILDFYIHDLILISNNLEYLCATKTLFTQRFSMTDNYKIEYILGIEIHCD